MMTYLSPYPIADALIPAGGNSIFFVPNAPCPFGATYTFARREENPDKPGIPDEAERPAVSLINATTEVGHNLL